MDNVLPFPGAPFTVGSDRALLNVPDGILPDGVEAVAMFDIDADLSYLETDTFPERRHAFEVGEFLHVGIYVERGCERCGSIVRSPGLWGVESDSGDEYLIEIIREQLEMLEEDDV